MDINDLKSASEKAGAQWVGEDIHGLPGVELHVRSSADKAVERFVGRAARQSTDRDDKGLLTQEAMDAIEDDAVAKVMLMGWNGLTDGDEELPYSQDKAAELMALPLFSKAVWKAANYVAVQSVQALEALAKNSQKPSRDKRAAAQGEN